MEMSPRNRIKDGSTEKGEHSRTEWIAYFLAFCGFAALLVVGSLVPFEFEQRSFSQMVDDFRDALGAELDFTRDRVDFTLNFIVTVPMAFAALGTLWTILVPKARAQIVAWRVFSLLITVVVCAAISLAVECGQVLLDSRVSSARDLLAQAIGMGVGIGIYLFIGPRVNRWMRSIHTTQRTQDRIVWALQAYLVGLVIYSVYPLDVITGPGELFGKLRSNQFEFEPFSFSYPSQSAAITAYFADALRFLPIGVLAALGFRRFRDQRRGLIEAICICALIVVAIEAIQLLIASRFTSITDVILGFAGGCAGIGLTNLAQRSNSSISDRRTKRSTAFATMSPWLLGVMVYIGVLIYAFWNPFEFTHDSDLIRQRFKSFVTGSIEAIDSGKHVSTLTAFLHAGAWFLGLGILLGGATFQPKLSRTVRLVLIATSLVLIGGVASVIELGQVLQPERVATLADVVVTSVSASLAFFLSALVWRGSGD